MEEFKIEFVIDGKHKSKQYSIMELLNVDEDGVFEQMEVCTCSLNESVPNCEGDCVRFEDSKITSFNVVTRTGLTPEQMDTELIKLRFDAVLRGDLEARLKEAERLTRTLLRSINAADSLKADQVINIIRNEAEDLLLFLTKEKTK